MPSPLASRMVHPVARSATAFMNSMRPRLSVAMTPLAMLFSVVESQAPRTRRSSSSCLKWVMSIRVEMAPAMAPSEPKKGAALPRRMPWVPSNRWKWTSSASVISPAARLRAMHQSSGW